MRSISDSTGPDSYGQTSWEGGDAAASAARKKHFQELIQRANTVPLTRIFKYYGLRIDAQNKAVACPFKSHKGGKEHTPSFHFYHETNSFCCYGCHKGGRNARGSEFIAAMDNISRVAAANKILHLFASAVDPDSMQELGTQDASERLEIMLDFSNAVREFRQSHPEEKSLKFIEGLCWVYDQHHSKRSYSNEAWRRLVDDLKERIASYDGKDIL